ncbi:MAG: metallophosphoesterase [Candidatus Aminicenantes bacterium]|nr:metallophosphoesterase [Candidatus Aminicenantes bacterium]
MRNSSFIALVTIVFSLYGLINYYLLKRGWQAFRGTNKLQLAYLIIFGLLSLAYPLSRILPSKFVGPARPYFLICGAFYLGFMFYLFLFVLAGDIIRFLARLIPFRNNPLRIWLSPASSTYKLSFGIFLALTTLVVILGYLNSIFPRIRTLEITVDKELPFSKPLRIVVITDLHLGSIVRLSRLERIVELINGLEPDLIFLVGDIIDEAVSSSQVKMTSSSFLRLKAKLGLIAVPGNHETYNRREKCLEEITGGSIRVLADEKIVVGKGLTIVGRRDRAIESMGVKRKQIQEILGDKESQGLLFLLDHQPINLEEAERAGVDLQVSGHTHAGQLFPLNLINRRLYEQYWGYHRRGQTHYYVSCGVGTWGPPLQTAARPEIVLLILKNSKNK